MREIKFRAKTRANGHWVYGSLVTYGPDSAAIVNRKSNPWVNPSTVGQFTGCLAYGGKQIYEGDILYHQDCPKSHAYREVIFQRGGFYLRNWLATTPIASHNIAAWEVVGNIHDNPELVQILNGTAKA